MHGQPQTSAAKKGSNRVLQTFFSHFSWRRPRGMVFGGQIVQEWTMPKGPNRVSLSGLDVEKKRGDDAPPMTRKVAQMAHGWRTF